MVHDAAVDEAAAQRGKLGRAPQTLEASLVRFRQLERRGVPPSDECDGQAAARIFGSPAAAMRAEPALQIDRRTRIERSIAAGQDVDGRKVAR